MVIRKVEVGLHFAEVVLSALAQVLIYAIWVYNLTWVHLPFRIPDRFEIAKRVDDLRTEHAREQFTSRLTIAVFARKRTFIADHQIGRLFEKMTPVLDAVRSSQVEREPGVHASLS